MHRGDFYMTDLSCARLCAFSYIHLPAAITGNLPMKLPLVVRQLLADGFSACDILDEETKRLLRALSDTLETAQLRLVEYIDEQYASGFSACVFLGRDGHVIAMRGSESKGPCAGNIDWIDNFAAPIIGSRQYGDIERLLRGYGAGPLLITGHSKGGHNALYALANSPNILARAVAFNAQGFGRGQLTAAQKQRLEARAVNYVTRGDIVGRLLTHPEKRISVCSCPYLRAEESGIEIAHRLGSLCFDPQGALVFCAK